MTSLLLAYSFFILNCSEDDAVIVRKFRHLLPESSTLLHLITSDHFIKEMTWEKEVTFSLKNTKNVLVCIFSGFFFFIINHLWIINLCICVIIYNNLIFFLLYSIYQNGFLLVPHWTRRYVFSWLALTTTKVFYVHLSRSHLHLLRLVCIKVGLIILIKQRQIWG